MIKGNNFMDMHHRDSQILCDIFFRLRSDQPFFFLDTVQQRQKCGPLLLVFVCDLVQFFYILCGKDITLVLRSFAALRMTIIYYLFLIRTLGTGFVTCGQCICGCFKNDHVIFFNQLHIGTIRREE